MSQFADSPPPVPPSIVAPPIHPAAMRPHVVHVVSKPGGFWRAASIIAALMLFGLVFFIGVLFGMFGTMAASKKERLLFHESYRDGSGSDVAVIPIEGVINGAQASFVRAAVDDVLESNSRPAAVILRVDSPGGEVTASDEIWYEIQRLKSNNVPVVASYGGVAASGGYYVSCGADHIFAQETTITGSIGVIAQILTLEGLMDKVGVQPVTLVATGSPEKSVANDMFRTWDERDKRKVQVMLDAAYATFLKRVQDGRTSAKPEALSQVANGSIYTAEQAKELGLVDTIGYLDDAIAFAETRAQIPTGSGNVYVIRRPMTLMSALLGAEERAASVHGLNADGIRTFVNDLASPRMMYLMQ